MANQFSQFLPQEYTPVPFQEMMETARINQATQGRNLQSIMSDADALDKLKAMPTGTSGDEADLASYKSTIDNLTNEFISNPKLLSNPNATGVFRQKVRSITDPEWLNRVQSSYDTWSKDQVNKEQLKDKGLYHESLETSPLSYSSRKGVWDQTTKPWEKPGTYIDPILKDLTGEPYMQENGVPGWRVDETMTHPEVLKHADEYTGTQNFRTNMRIFYPNVNIDDLSKTAEGQNTLRNYSVDLLSKEESKFWKGRAQKGFKGSGSGSGGASSDIAFADLYDNKTNQVSDKTLTAVLGNKDEENRYTVPLGENEGIMKFSSIDPDMTPQKQLGLNKALELKKLNEASAGLDEQLSQLGLTDQKGKITNRDGNTDSGESEGTLVNAAGGQSSSYGPLNTKISQDNIAKVEALQQKKDELAKQYQDLYSSVRSLGITPAELTKLSESADKIDSDGSEQLGALLSMDGSAKFMPDKGKDNIHHVKNEDGTNDAYVHGRLLVPKSAINNWASNHHLSDEDRFYWAGWFKDDWEEKFLKERGGNGLIQSTIDKDKSGEPLYSIPYFKKIALSDNVYESVNASYLDGKDFDASVTPNRVARNERMKTMASEDALVGAYKQDPSTLAQAASTLETAINDYKPELDNNPMDKEKMLDLAKRLQDKQYKPTEQEVREVASLYSELGNSFSRLPIWAKHNNPGNIKVPNGGIEEARKRYGDPGARVGTPATDGGNFIRFSSMSAGKQALPTLLKTVYGEKLVRDTLPIYSNGGYGSEIAPSIANKKINDLTDSEFQYLVNAILRSESKQ